MGKTNETEVPGASDTIPEDVQKVLDQKDKPSITQAINQVPGVSPTYQSLSYSDRPSTSATEGPLDHPIEYFNLFITPEQRQVFASNTNENARRKRSEQQKHNDESDSDDDPTPRVWHSVEGETIGVFIGVLLLMGLTRNSAIETYWSTHTDKGRSPEITAAISLKCWQQIKRYFHISNPATDPSTNRDWIAKIRPFLNEFLLTCRRLINPGKKVSIDEQLILFKGRSKHSMRIDNKIAGQGFKVYSLCVGNYLLGLQFASKKSKIDGLHKIKGLPDTSSLVVQLMKQLPEPWEYVVYLDNFFTRVSLLKHLKGLGFGACGTAKNGSGIAHELVIIRALSKKNKDWGTFATTTIDDEVLCISWQDNNTVLFMTTAHSEEEARAMLPKDIKKRHGIPANSATIMNNTGTYALAFPKVVCDYNQNMGGSDGNAQQRSYYTAETRRDRRYWWCLFLFLLDAAILNAYILFQMNQPDSKISHSEFQRQVALALIRDPAGQRRKHPYDFGNTNPSIELSDHRRTRLKRKRTCVACKASKRRRSSKTAPLQEISSNIRRKGTQDRAPQSYYGYTSPDCEGLGCCLNAECWEQMHS